MQMSAVDKQEMVTLANPAFGSLVKAIHGANYGGIRNHVNIFEKGAEVIGAKTWKGCLGSRGCLWFCVNCCPKSETRTMYPAHRFTGAYIEKSSICCGGCFGFCTCCPYCKEKTAVNFSLTNDDEVRNAAFSRV